MKTLPYREGTCFALPLRKSGYAAGVVARMAPGGRIVLAYLFGPKHGAIPTMEDVAQLGPKDAIKCIRMGDLGLVNGEWSILGESPDWRREAWVTPEFVRRDDVSRRAWRSVYSDSDPSKLEQEEPMAYDGDLEEDGLYGYGAVELLMTKLLDSNANLNRNQ